MKEVQIFQISFGGIFCAKNGNSMKLEVLEQAPASSIVNCTF